MLQSSARHNDLKAEKGESLLCAKDKPSIYKLPTQTRLKLSVRKWSVAAKWRWSIGEGPCGICRETFDSCCVTCHTPGDECPIAIGVCRHAFHMHCIVKWTKSQKVAYPVCPLCRQKWEFAPMEHTNGCPMNWNFNQHFNLCGIAVNCILFLNLFFKACIAHRCTYYLS